MIEHMFPSWKERLKSLRQRAHKESDEPRDLRLVALVNEARTEEEQRRIAAGR